jgi:hypothetical protein
MKYVRSFTFILLAGTCAGMFWFVRSLPVFRFYLASGTDIRLLWTPPAILRLGAYILLANVLLLVIWLAYGVFVKRFSTTPLNTILREDAATYLPLCLLSLSLFQFKPVQVKGFILLSQNLEGLLLLLVGLGVAYLKIRNLGQTILISEKTRNMLTLRGIVPMRIALGVFLISLLVYLGVGFRVLKRLPLGGDEPHYLLIAHSLLRDHDLAIHNNYKQRDYQAFYSAELKPHLSIGRNDVRYPGHPIGLPLLLVPVYALKGRQGAVILMNFLAAVLAVQIYFVVRSITQHPWLSLLLWSAISFSTPLLLYSAQIYPEIPSALLLLTAYRLIRTSNDQKGRSFWRMALLGGSLALAIWFQQRVLLAALFLLLLYVLTSIQRLRDFPQQNKRSLALLSIPVLLVGLSGLALAGYYYTLYGNPLPSAPYQSIGWKTLFSWNIFLKQGLLGLLFDQEAGLLLFSPFYLLALPGLLLMFRRNALQACCLMACIGSIYLPSGGYVDSWRGAWSPAARYTVAMIPFFVPLLAEVFGHVYRHVRCRYLLLFLAGISAGWSYIFLRTPTLSIMQGRGVNSAFEQYGNNVVNLSRYVPAFHEIPPLSGYLLAGIWILVALAVALVVYGSVKKGWNALAAVPLIKQVFINYGLICVLALLLTAFAEYMPDNASFPAAKNKHLREFLIHFKRYAWIAPDLSIAPEEARFEYVSREKSGKAGTGERFLVSGPREPFPKGKYTASFSVLIEEPTDEPVVSLDVTAGRGTAVFAAKLLHGQDFTRAGTVQIFSLSFELPHDVGDLETRVFFHNQTDVTIQKIYIQPDLTNWPG